METLMDRATVTKIESAFKDIIEVVPLRAIHNDIEYDEAVKVLNALLDAGGADEYSPLAGLVDALGMFIRAYEDEHVAAAEASPVAVMRLLMAQHGLGQSDLPEIGTQGVVSEILSGKRELNVRQIRALAERFSVSASLFI